MSILNDPFVLSAVLATILPLVAAWIATVGMGVLVGARAAGVAIVIAFVVAYLAILGRPPWPPQSSLQKIAYVAVAGTVVGAVLEPATLRTLVRPIAIIWPGVLVVWIGWPQLRSLGSYDVLVLIPLWLGGAVVFERLAAHRETALVAPTMVLVAGIATSLVAMLGSAASLAQLAAVVAAASGGFLLWNWPRRRYPFSIVTLFGTASALFGIIVSTVLFTRSSKSALAVMLLVFLFGTLWNRVPIFQRPLAGPIAFGFTAAVPMLLTVAVAYLAVGAPADN